MKNKAYILAVCYAVIIGFSPLFLKQAVSYQHPSIVVIHRFCIASIIFHLIFRSKISLKTYLKLIPLSLLFPILTFIFQAFALQSATTVQVGIIQANVPIIASIGAYLVWKEKLTFSQIGYIALSSFGVIFIFVHSLRFEFNVGIFYSLIATLSWGIYSVYVRYFFKELDVISITKVTITNTAFFYVVYGLIMNINFYNIDFALPYIVSVGYLSTFATVASMSILVYITSKLGVSKASAFNNLATIMTLIVGTILLKEKFEYYHIIGGAVVIFAIYRLNRR